MFQQTFIQNVISDAKLVFPQAADDNYYQQLDNPTLCLQLVKNGWVYKWYW